jgi:hypothetical protein
MDLDGDGDLDLVVGSYVEFGPNARRYCELVRGVRSGCPPHEYEPQFARYYENSGAGRFIDRSRRAGMETTHGKALAVGFVDFNGDGRMDFYLANDGTPGDLMENQGGGRFRNVGLESGAAFGAMGQAQAGMGVDWSDFDGDGAMDFAVTAFSGEPYSLYRGVGMLFEHAGDRMGLAAPTRTRLGFGVKFTDVDCDGWPDLVFVNGHVYDNAHLVSPELSYRQPTMLLRNEEGRRFRLLGSEAGEGLARPIVGRGLAAGDYDNDGREDLLIVDYEGTPLLLRNVGPRVHHWLIVDVRSRGRPAYGARVEVRAGPRRWKRWVSPASAYLSSSDPRLHFGVGAATQVDVSVRWPGGFRRELRDAAVDRILRVDDAR